MYSILFVEALVAIIFSNYLDIEADSWPNRSSLCFINNSIADKTSVTPLPKSLSCSAWKTPACRESIPSPSRSPLEATRLYVTNKKKCYISIPNILFCINTIYSRKLFLLSNKIYNNLTDIGLHMVLPISCKSCPSSSGTTHPVQSCCWATGHRYLHSS